MNVYFMLAFTRSLNQPNPVLVELIHALRRRHFEVEIGIGEELLAEPSGLVVEHDLCILKSHAPLWLSIAGMVHSRHGRLLNPYQACLATHNKIIASWWLHAAQIPTPPTWITGDLNLMARLASERPLIIKPYSGGRGIGVQVIRTPQELAEIQPPTEPVVIQEFIPNANEVKAYVVGQELFGLRKYETQRGSVREVCRISPEMRSIALHCGRLFGLGLYGLDFIEGPDGPVVVDVNYFPSYKGVPDAAKLIADYVDDYAHGRLAELIPGDRLADDWPILSQIGAVALPKSGYPPADLERDVRIGTDLRYYISRKDPDEARAIVR
jgi:ribosomal protein S6--L-glutamate ligase